ncbi:unnamed protein product, partial [Mesorhabditis spiculigera]
MTDAMREMIAGLMGDQRAKEEGRNLPPYSHHTVCRAYLLGCCPAELLQDTRLENLVACRKMHEPTHKADYEGAQAKNDHFYDVELYNTLQDTIRVIDSEIDKTKMKLDRESREAGEGAEIVKMKRIGEIEEQIRKLVTESEELGTQGRVEDAMHCAKRIEELEQRKEELKSEARAAGGTSAAQRLRVCEDCGAQLNIMDHETRLADHFGGKMHLGMVEVRERFTEMGETIEQRRKEQNEKGAVGRDRRSPDRRDRGDRGDRDRDRDRRDRDRRRSRSRSRDRRRRSTSRDRRDRDRRRDERDRDRDRRRR